MELGFQVGLVTHGLTGDTLEGKRKKVQFYLLNIYIHTFVYLHFLFFNNTIVFTALPQSQCRSCKVLSCKVSIEVCLVTYLQAGRGPRALPSAGTLTKQIPSSSVAAGRKCHFVPTAQPARARHAWGTGMEDQELIQWVLGLKSALLFHVIRYQWNPISTEGWTCSSYSSKPCLHPTHRKSHFSQIIIFLHDVSPIASIWSSWECGVRAVQKQSTKQNWIHGCSLLGTECPTHQQVPGSSCTEESALP